jgi:hypothetical protein
VHLAEPGALLVVGVALSQPGVQRAGGDAAAAACQGESRRALADQAGVLLALVSTLAGNLLLVGSIANLIVGTWHAGADVRPVDRADLMNITWVYTDGATILGQPDGVDLGVFSAKSLFSTPGQVSYAARGVKNTGASAGSIADNVGNTIAPVNVVPEPGSLGLAGLGLALLVGGLRKRATAA